MKSKKTKKAEINRGMKIFREKCQQAFFGNPPSATKKEIGRENVPNLAEKILGNLLNMVPSLTPARRKFTDNPYPRPRIRQKIASG